MSVDSRLPAHAVLAEPQLAFHPDRADDRSAHPLKGLVSYGPFSRSTVNAVLDPIRAAAITPARGLRVIDGLLVELEGRHEPQERRNYLVEFPGFSHVFGLRVVAAANAARIELASSLDAEIAQSATPHLLLAENLTRALGTLQAVRQQFDVVLIYLPVRWSRAFYGPREEDFDLHDYVKAVGAMRGLPVQIVREDKALSYRCRCSVMWRLGIALYCKAGGIPWKLAEAEPDAAFVGLSYAVRTTGEGTSRFVTCCSQVFDADGSGIEFVAYETSGFRIERENPYLNRPEMRRVMARSLALYQRRHAGRKPKRVVVHKSTKFTDEEIDACFDAWQGVEALDLIQVQQDCAWRGVELHRPATVGKGIAGGFPCERGTHLTLSGRDVLLWTQGNAPSAVGGRNFYKEGKAIPAPLQLVRFAGHGGWEPACRDVLGLTKMDWNNDSLYDRLPVTMSYARVLARTVKRMSDLAPHPYEFRVFM